MVKLLGRWAPLVGGVVLVTSVVLRMTGNVELADMIFNLGGIFGLNAPSPVPVVELAGAAGVVLGIVRKFLAVAKA